MLELCPSRYAVMFPNRGQQDSPAPTAHAPSHSETQRYAEEPTDGEESPGAMVDTGTRAVNEVLRNISKLMAFLGMKPGCDFVAAVDAARAVEARLVLGDRCVSASVRRCIGLSVCH